MHPSMRPLLPEGDGPSVSPWRYVDPVLRRQWLVLLVPRLYPDLAAEGEGAPGLEGEGSRCHSDGHGVRVALVDVECHFLKLEVLGLLGEDFPHVLGLGAGEDRLFGRQLLRVVPDFYIHDAPEHGLKSGQFVLPFLPFSRGQFRKAHCIQVAPWVLASDAGPTDSASGVGQARFSNALGAEDVSAVGLQGPVESFPADRALMLSIQLPLPLSILLVLSLLLLFPVLFVPL